MFRTLNLPTLLLALAVAALAGCEQEGPFERAGEKLDGAIEEAGDKVEDVTDRK